MVTFRIVPLCAALASIVAFSSTANQASAASVPVSGSFLMYWADFDAAIDPVELTFDGEVFNTGPISIALDKDATMWQRLMRLDFDTLSHSFSMPIVLTAPLFGAEEQKATFDFNGPIFDVNPVSLPDNAISQFSFSFDSFGRGTFGPGNTLEGWTYSNIFNTTNINVEVKDSNIRVLSPDIPVNVNGTIRGTLTPPATCPNCGVPVSIRGTDSGTLVPIPLPAAGWMLLLGLGALAVVRSRQSVARRARAA